MSSSNEELKPSAENEHLEEMEEEMAFEEDDIVKSEEHLQQQLALAEKKAEENWELLLRTKAEMDNLRKRTEKDLENAHKYGMEKFVNEMLPVKDSMELGLAAEDVTVESLHEGMKLTMNMFNATFEKIGVKEINPLNEPFDPELHQVIAVRQKGYLLKDRLVRPAMVMVSKKPE